MKTKTIFSCSNCGYQSPKWIGRCPDCSSWNSFVEDEPLDIQNSLGPYSSISNVLPASAAEPLLLKDVQILSDSRFKTQITELDRVLGGGVVKGSVILLGGDPGIGKSTISLQICNRLSREGLKVLYVSAEESVQQTKIRAQRLGAVSSESLYIVNQTDLTLIIEYVNKIKPNVLVIDSIQVIFAPNISSSPGSVSQVRECSNILTKLAKTLGVSMFIIGHVTKEGSIAGPRVLEHLVDTVLYFEGDKNSSYRILRAVKNRFGSTNEIAVFQMAHEGLKDVSNPSQIFLSERPENTSGSVVTSCIEGTRPMLLEIQALVTRTAFGYPTRRSEGFDYNRLNLIVAVLEKRLGLHLENEDIFINVVGGVKVDDPSCDLSVGLAVVSSFKEKIAKKDTVIIGEIGLASEIRSVSQISLRIKEAARLGFKQCVIPRNNLDKENDSKEKIELIKVKNIQEAIDAVFSY